MMRFTPRRILLACWLVFLLYAYPGYLQADAVDELFDSRMETTSDWHSAVFTQIWRVVGIFISGPPGMLVLQSGLTLLGLFWLARRQLAERTAAIVAGCVLLAPPIMANVAVVSSDALLVALLLVSAGLLCGATRRQRLGGVAALILGCALRNGTALAALPLVIALCQWHEHRPRWQRIGIAIAVWSAVVLAALGVERLCVDVASERKEMAFAMADIIGTLRYAEPVDDASVQALLVDVPLATTTQIQDRAHKVYGRNWRYAFSDDRVFERAETSDEREALYAAHWRVVRALPGPYLRYRLHLLARMLGVAGRPPPLYTKFVPTIPHDAEVLQHYSRHSLLQRALIWPVKMLARTFLFRPVVYLAIALVVLVLAIVRRNRDAAMLVCSGVLYELGLTFVTESGDYRDSHWLIVASVFAATLLVMQEVAARRANPPDR